MKYKQEKYNGYTALLREGGYVYGKTKKSLREKYKGNICSFYPITDYKDWFLKYKARFLIEASLFLCLTYETN